MTDEHAAPVVRAIWCATKDCLNDLGNGGEYTVTIDAHPLFCRDDGTPAQLGDVLSCQDDGTLQARPEGTDGYSERCITTPTGLLFRPTTGGYYAWLVPYTDVWPNQ
jgi:hypothetical protein